MGPSKQTLYKKNCVVSVASFAHANARGLELHVVVLLTAMYVWGGYLPDPNLIWTYNSIDELKAQLYVLYQQCAVQ